MKGSAVMSIIVVVALTLATAGTWGIATAAAGPAELVITPAQTAMSETLLTGPPMGDGPVIVRTRFQLRDINEIDDEAETFEFEGVLALTWHDPRQAFDPAKVGVREKVFQGAYQFNEVFVGWFPQVTLVNESGMYEKHGVVLRVQSDGTLTLIETLNAIAKADLDLRRHPFDRQTLKVFFEVLGFGVREVLLQAESTSSGSTDHVISIPQWIFKGASVSIGERTAAYAGHGDIASTFVVSMEVQRKPMFMLRLVIFPLVLIVMLSWSVFWMDRSSLGDRTSVSFVGILTAVSYQIVVSGSMPQISYLTLTNAFVNLSFSIMCATVVINLVVGAVDKVGKHETGDHIDRLCRWIFPLVYFGVLLLALGAVFL